MSRHRLFTLAMLKKLAAPLGMLALIGAGTVSSAGCSSDSTGSGGAGGARGAGGAGGAGGEGGNSGSCTTPAQCPGTDTDCQTRSCTAGVCGFDNAPAGKATSTQNPGDCQASVCDGMGATTTQNDDTDVLDDSNDCTDDVCTAGAPKNTPKASGATCASDGGTVCDGANTCVECIDAAGCSAGVCSANNCVPASCLDTVKNAKETDIDCGGTDCNPCTEGKICVAGTDCLTTICTAGACAAATCTDAAKNGKETDIDCGSGTCAPCGPTQMCSKGSDCATGVCTGNVCQGAICKDGVKNGTETDVDCGGICATKCATGKICSVALDCASSICTGGKCAASVCGDGVKNGAEACDDSNPVSHDGCSSACAIEAGFTCAGTAPSVCMTTCGDGIQAGAEQCDDTNPTTGDGCSSACAIELGFTCAGAPSVCTTTCGDGFEAGAEACDDGNGIPNDGCTACAVNVGFVCTGSAPSVCAAVCGDGIQAGAEPCDDGNTVAGDGCSATCTVQSGYTCTGAPSVCATACGDGVLAGAEQCDDNNLANGDCCSSTCQSEAGCEIEPNGTIATANSFATLAVGNKINGFIKPAADKDYYAFTIPASATGTLTTTLINNFLGVTCASANIDSFITLFTSAAAPLASNDDISGASNRCSAITQGGLPAGTYYLEVKAYSSTAQFAYTLQSSLSLAICGNSIVEGSEECDGGATCAANCTILPICGNGLITSTETCDDGNTANGDGCDASCQFEGGVNETELNNTQAQADANPAITGDAQFLGSIGSAGDKDLYKVTVATAGVVRFETFESVNLDCPTIALTMKLFDSAFVQQKIDVQGSANASGINTCAAIVLALPVGSYYVQIEKTTAGIVPKYVFQTKFSTNVGSEIEPNGTLATATPMAGTNMDILGAHVSADLDWYAITLATNGLSVRAETIEETANVFTSTAHCENLGIDTLLTLFNSAATSLASDDNDGRGYCSAIDGTSATPRDAGAHNLAAGTYYLQVSTGSTYAYRLAVTLR